MSKQLRVGFTLVELLVVITIIALLVGLLLPAVITARAQARRTQCTHNQGELGKALANYVSDKKFYPGYVNRSLASSNQRPLTWLEMLLPYVDQEAVWTGSSTPGNNLWGATTATTPWRVTQYQMSLLGAASIVVPVYVCPSDSNPNNVTTPASKTSYVANCGVEDQTTNSIPNPTDRLPADTNPNPRYNGVFTFQYLAPTSSPVRIRPEDVRDGQAQTLLISENLQAGSWYDPYAVSSNVPAPFLTSTAVATVAADIEPMVGLVWWPDSNLPGCAGINDDSVPPYNVPDSTYYFHARPSSGHPGGVVVTYCNGHADFLRSDTDYSVLRQLMTPNGAAATTAAGNPLPPY